ncbi:MAG: ribosome-associated translation inhibitor RaiA [Acidimicrobiales bacterium]|nr:ribosome-associated translation inhibitor RaiA [Acidimicrobiales bacterium]
MDVSISARHVTITPRLEEVIHEKIGQLDRYLEGLDYAGVHFEEAQNPRIADKEFCEVHLKGNGHHLRCKVHAPDPFTAIDLAEAKLERQIRKLRTKIQRRQHGTGESLRNGDVSPAAMADDAGEPEIDADEMMPEIVRTKRFHLAPLTPVEAVEKMEELGHGFFFFINRDTSRSAVVYKRDDGNVGLIDEAD